MLKRHLALCLMALMTPLSLLAQAWPTNGDDNCKFKSGQTITAKRTGGVSVLNVGSGDPIECPSAKCSVPVKVMTFNRTDSGQLACCIQIGSAEVRVAKKAEDVPITWTLAPDDAADKSEYAFAVNALIPFDQGNGKNPKADELLPSVTAMDGKSATALSVNKHSGQKKFNYFLNVVSKTTDGQYLVCDPTDPVIINNGK